MLLFTNFITCRFIWLPQDETHLGHSVWAPLFGNQTHYFQPTSQFSLSDGEELGYDQPQFYQQRDV